MEHREIQLNAVDNLKLYGQVWRNEQSPKAVILLVHGLGEHSSRYQQWVQRFINEGYAVTSIDYRGHGRSEGKRGYAKSYQLLLQDINMLHKKTEELFPLVPLIIYGHSLGGNIALNYALVYRPCISGIIVTSPWLRLARNPGKAELLLAKIITRLFPSYTAPTRLNPEHLSHIDKVIHDYKADPLVHDKIGARLYLEAKDAGEYAMRSIHKINTPMLLMHGSHDKITSAHASSSFVKNAGFRTQFKLWKGLYHELHHEKENDRIFAFIMQWFQELPSLTAKSKSDGYF